MTLRLVLADDQALVRRGFRLILESEPGLSVVAEAGDGREVVEAVRRCRPVRAAAAGDALLSPSVTRSVLHRMAEEIPDSTAARERLVELTEREVEVLRLLAAGLSNAEIAASLILGEATIKTHVSNLLAKLHRRDRVQAVVFAYESGLVRPSGRHPG